MKRIFLFVLCSSVVLNIVAQKNIDKAIMKEVKGGTGYYYETILKDINAQPEVVKEKSQKRFQVDYSKMNLPNKFELYKTYWHNKPVSQGNTGTCWDFSGLSFIESEIYRINNTQIKLSEMYIAYWEYIEKARRFIEERGNSVFKQGSEANAVTRMIKKYGIVPVSIYNGKTKGEKFYNHDPMYEEMNTYLHSLKKDNNWNIESGLSTIKSILNHYMGQPPIEFSYEGKKYTPQSYLNTLKFNPDDYIDVLSYMQQPFWKKVEYEVEDNWWHDDNYYNIPVEDFINLIKKSIRNGYTLAIGGDVSEPGFDRETQVAIVPDFDIPSEYINDAAKQLRFSNNTTTDDHGMHLVGYTEQNGKYWFIVKDSGSGSRNNSPDANEFGYYFMHEDYVKLKIMDFQVHKDALKDILNKF